MGAVALRSLLAVMISGTSGLVAAEPASEAARTVVGLADPSGVQQEVTAQRLGLTPPGATALTPDGRQMNELAAVQYRLWKSHGRADFGVGLGTIGYVQPALGLRADGPVALSGATPLVSIGMRYRVSAESAVFADASGTRALPSDTGGPYVSTKIGMEWKPAQSHFGLEGGALRIQFDSGYKLSLKARRDGLGVYLRSQF
jgi:hypothetical protein